MLGVNWASTPLPQGCPSIVLIGDWLSFRGGWALLSPALRLHCWESAAAGSTRIYYSYSLGYELSLLCQTERLAFGLTQFKKYKV
jgi:hypothetical protein